MARRPPAPDPDPAPGDRKREADAQRQRHISATSREVGAIPPIANVRRRARCRKSLRAFCETYLYETFKLAWAPTHLDELARMEECVFVGALYALADPRGDGKTARSRACMAWAVSNGLLPYLLFLGANGAKAEEALDTVKLWFRYLPEFGADYPEVAAPVRALKGIANRAAGQTCLGESTLIEWGQDQLVLPTVPPPPNWPKAWPLRADGMVPTAGAIVRASGLTGEGIRGSVIATSAGQMVRPRLVLLDDPQTDESAHSKSQNATRKKLISSAVLGLAGPGERIAAIMPCTVIAKGDAVDEILDRSRHPLWRGTRRGILTALPTNLKAWDAYFEVYDRCALAEPPDFAEANAYYREHRAELDAGAEATWPERKEPADVSAVQHAMHLYHRDVWAFWSEYMNAPLDELTGPVSRRLDARLVRARWNRVPRLEVPRECTRLTGFVDCHGNVLFYVVCGWDERFNGGVVDYGTWPAQPSPYFAQADPPRALADLYPGFTEEQFLYAGLQDLAAHVLGRRYARHGTAEVLAVERCLVDEGYRDKVVYQFCRESPHAGVLMPSKGHVPKTLGATPMSGWQARTGERAARPGQPSWRVGPVGSGKGRHCLFEANEWKTLTATLLAAPPGGGGCLQLFGDEAADHQLLADHCTAELAVPVVLPGGRRVERWEARPNQDNHFWDCLVGCAVAAGTLGVEWSANRAGPAPETKTPPPRYADVVKARQTPEQAPVPAGAAGERRPQSYADARRQREQERRGR